MVLLFLSQPGTLRAISVDIYSAIGVTNYSEGNSSNVLDGIYYEGMLQECSVRIELNSYEYEQLYSIMLTIKCLNGMRKPELEGEVADHVISLLLAALKIPIAKESGIGGMSIFKPHEES